MMLLLMLLMMLLVLIKLLMQLLMKLSFYPFAQMKYFIYDMSP